MEAGKFKVNKKFMHRVYMLFFKQITSADVGIDVGIDYY